MTPDVRERFSNDVHDVRRTARERRLQRRVDVDDDGDAGALLGLVRNLLECVGEIAGAEHARTQPEDVTAQIADHAVDLGDELLDAIREARVADKRRRCPAVRCPPRRATG